ncbi:MAG TPA: hypothetical protein VGS19_18080 [Streptosporangiaceae bacterium]|nr:hypothetical protein [Streptosporangiaceae bacterium]
MGRLVLGAVAAAVVLVTSGVALAVGLSPSSQPGRSWRLRQAAPSPPTST